MIGRELISVSLSLQVPIAIPPVRGNAVIALYTELKYKAILNQH